LSSNTYTLKIDIDDSKIRDLEKRLSKLMSGTATGGMAGVSGAATGKTGAGGSIQKNIAKLGLIAIGVGSLVALVKKIGGMLVDSSPMLKGMLKLLNYSVMLIFRPIGDFIGFFLRPIMIYFLRSIALPWYKQMRPIMQKLGSMIGIDVMKRQSQIDSIESKNGLQEGFKWEIDGLKNLEKQFLGFSSFLSIFEEGETQFESTKEAIAAFKGAFTAINGFTIPTLDTTWLDTWVKNNLSIDKFPTLDISAIQTKINSAITALVPSFSLTGIQDKIDAAVTAIATFDVAEVFTTIGEKIEKIFDDLVDGIYNLIPFLDRPDSGSSKVDTTSPLPPYAGTLESNFGSEQKPEKDGLSAWFELIGRGANETIASWGLS
jgi:hypothetical protein